MQNPPGQPLLPGFHPDPTWVRVEGYTYLATSTFSWLPGIPVYRSRDHQHWEALPHVIPNSQTLPFTNCEVDAGLYAPGLRHDGKRFLLACTIVHRHTRQHHNFICTSEDPAQGWSEPVRLPRSLGQVDPTPFIEDDGSLWLVLNASPSENEQNLGNRSIRLWELDPSTLQPKEGPHTLWHGAMVNAPHPEGPRLFKKDGWYWLMISEGGTGPTHAITMARSRTLTGPYEGCIANPLLTHRHLGRKEPIQCVGHADFLQDEQGQWHGVCLAERVGTGHRLMGRETWFFPMEWEDDQWPVLCPQTGKLPPESKPLSPIREDSWISLRKAPAELATALSPDEVSFPARPDDWTDPAKVPALFAKRVTATWGKWSVSFHPEDAPERYGIILFAKESAWLVLEVVNDTVQCRGPEQTLFGAPRSMDADKTTLTFEWKPGEVRAQIGEHLIYAGTEAMTLIDQARFTGLVAGVWALGTTGSLTARIISAEGVDHHPAKP